MKEPICPNNWQVRAVLLSPCHRLQTKTQRLSNLTQVSQLINAGSGTWSLLVFQVHGCIRYSFSEHNHSGSSPSKKRLREHATLIYDYSTILLLICWTNIYWFPSRNLFRHWDCNGWKKKKRVRWGLPSHSSYLLPWKAKRTTCNWPINKIILILETHTCSEESLNRSMRDGAS